MTSQFRSDPTTREEKAFGSVTFPRFLSCLMIAGGGYFLASKVIGIASLCVAPILFSIAIFLTGQHYGVTRALWFFYDMKARLVLFSADHPNSTLAQVLVYTQFDIGAIELDSDEMFVKEKDVDVMSLVGIEFLDGDSLGAGGIEFVDDDFEIGLILED